MAKVQHSAGTPEWSTPTEVIDIARMVLGKIHFDPCSSLRWNTRVGAERFGSLPGGGGHVVDSLKSAWLPHFPRADHVLANILPSDLLRAPEYVKEHAYNVFLNPPGSEDGELAKRAWALLDFFHRYHWISSAFYVGFSLNQLQTLQNEPKRASGAIAGGRSPLHRSFIRCIPRRRLEYFGEKGAGEQPSHPSFFLLMPRDDQQRSDFRSLAMELGDVF